jgi:hypothetical protein
VDLHLDDVDARTVVFGLAGIDAPLVRSRHWHLVATRFARIRWAA